MGTRDREQNKVRYAVVGLGHISQVAILPAFAHARENSELTAIVCLLLVVTVQVVGASMRWSDQKPYAVDLRSARATPAPPIMMVNYSARLALVTTLTGLMFSGLSRLSDPSVSVLVAVVCLAWSMTPFVSCFATPPGSTPSCASVCWESPSIV